MPEQTNDRFFATAGVDSVVFTLVGDLMSILGF
jgi:hypothetical protein